MTIQANDRMYWAGANALAEDLKRRGASATMGELYWVSQVVINAALAERAAQLEAQ